MLLDIGQILTWCAPVISNLFSAYSKPSCAAVKNMSWISGSFPVVGIDRNHLLCKSTSCAKFLASLIEPEGLRIDCRFLRYQP